MLTFLVGCGISAAYLVPWSMLPDVIDDSELRTYERNESIFYSFFVFFQKFGAVCDDLYYIPRSLPSQGIALALSTLSLEYSGYNANPCCDLQGNPEVHTRFKSFIIHSCLPAPIRNNN